MSDPREAAARYRALKDNEPDAAEPPPPVQLTAENKHEFVETAIQLAIRRGEFDDLPGAGKPLEGLGAHHDPDWWIRRKIESENLTGLGPPAILLRTEDRELNDQLDRIPRAADVREVLEDFNKRVINARRQLQGGPPVVTQTRDVEVEIAAWAERRAVRPAASAAPASAPESAPAVARPPRRWFRRT